MASAIPSSFSFEMLSRLPANSFVLTWKEVRPNQSPIGNNGVYEMSQSNRIQFVLRGAPNEFALNTNMYLCGSARLNVSQAVAGGTAPSLDNIAEFAASATSYLGNPINFFQGSRESFNAGALPYLDNQDPVRSQVINSLRYRCARRNTKSNGTEITDLSSAFCSPQNGLEFSDDRDTLSFDKPAEGVRLNVISNVAGSRDCYNFGDKHFQIPLGTYSNFVNSHSILPLGLLSSYAVNGWQIELQTNVQDSASGPVYQCATSVIGTKTTGVTLSANAYLNDLRIYVPIIRVLDPAVMEAVLSLYEKREMVNVGGVQFPLSLRINTIAYRFANYPLNLNQNDFFFRIAGTDRSVRAMAWWIYRRSTLTSTGLPSMNVATRVTRLQTSIGNEQIHDVVEDNNVNTSNVANFISMNAKRSACLFSPLPYYQEGRKEDGQQDDDLVKYNNTYSAIDVAGGTAKHYQKRALAYGIVSFENLDRRENEYSGSFQASGKDLTNVGAIELRMRIEQYGQGGVSYVSAVAPSTSSMNSANLLEAKAMGAIDNGNDYEIVFAYAYDSVMEISPQGVMDVTNAIL